MRSYLIVGNETLSGESLTQAINDRLAEGPIRARVVVPLTRIGGRLTWDEQESMVVAQTRLDEALGQLRALGIEAEGEVGDGDPILAVKDAMRGHEIDEIILSTLPSGVSRWLGADVPGRLRDAVTVPVTVVTQHD
jgi:nucleotide-binding universal stress UspA family protein